MTLADRELLERLGWFTRVRWVMGGSALLILLVSWYVLGVRFRPEGGPASMVPAVIAVLAVFFYNTIFVILGRILKARGRTGRRLIMQLVLAQLACDMMGVCSLAHYTGGVENFFIILVLLPLATTARLLPKSLTYAMAIVTVLMVNALAWGEQQGVLPHVFVEFHGIADSQLYSDWLYVLEVTAALTATIFALTLITSSISTRLREREIELERAHRTLEEIDETKSFFMRKAGHDMRSPLAAIHSMIDALDRSLTDPSDDQQRLIKRSKYRLVGLMELVGDLRRYAMLRSSNSVLNTTGLALDRLVTEATEVFREQARQVNLTLTCETEPVDVEADEELLREVITNLVANAVQYTLPGGRIDVSLVPHCDEARLSVADTGIGVAPGAREKLFRELFRSQEARVMLPEGTGMGLAITRHIVEMHSGRIEYAAAPGGGSIFTVHLPMLNSADDLPESPVLSKMASGREAAS